MRDTKRPMAMVATIHLLLASVIGDEESAFSKRMGTDGDDHPKAIPVATTIRDALLEIWSIIVNNSQCLTIYRGLVGSRQ